ncbi:hypothetical protein L1987_79052 [Smallanthus sonchifolius]|uniref:Uncharacterized protein n=1 Tax=Smallanthus sonchifolius TaxID=185202 RepID=A0ACB8ZEL3_9ASTR|nr:hypothetical protein L1987_79052 [Smallanthus sonchifolius]
MLTCDCRDGRRRLEPSPAYHLVPLSSFGNLFTRFLPSTASVFQVSAAVAMVSIVYMRRSLPESSTEAAVIAASLKEETVNECLLKNRYFPVQCSLVILAMFQILAFLLDQAYGALYPNKLVQPSR